MSAQRAVVVFGSSQTARGSKEWDDAELVGQTLAESGLAVITGGYGGTMEAVSMGAAGSSGHVIGVTAPDQFPHREGANRYVREEMQATNLTHRIEIMMDRAAGAMALPGSIGTATELLVAWNINHVVRNNSGRSIPTVAVGTQWKAVADTLVTEVGASPGDLHLAADVDEGLEWLLGELKGG